MISVICQSYKEDADAERMMHQLQFLRPSDGQQSRTPEGKVYIPLYFSFYCTIYYIIEPFFTGQQHQNIARCSQSRSTLVAESLLGEIMTMVSRKDLICEKTQDDLRKQITQWRLNNLLLFQVHKDRKDAFNMENILHQFYTNDRRRNFFGGV